MAGRKTEDVDVTETISGVGVKLGRGSVAVRDNVGVMLVEMAAWIVFLEGIGVGVMFNRVIEVFKTLILLLYSLATT